jgi:hypothetical protein
VQPQFGQYTPGGAAGIQNRVGKWKAARRNRLHDRNKRTQRARRWHSHGSGLISPFESTPNKAPQQTPLLGIRQNAASAQRSIHGYTQRLP